ncbi:MAG: 2-oxoacid:acceptor oxidoreductase family protein [Calditrichia bacterium]|nr:2-oxoacid:acceptor oxidoreductase family protein [Calditrichia bacterium]
MSFPYKIRISGDVGSDLVFIGRVIGEAATVYEGYQSIQSHSCGEEIRGEANCSDLIINNEKIHSPSFDKPNILLCLAQIACCEFVQLLSDDGVLIMDSDKVIDLPEKHERGYYFPFYQTALDKFDDSSSANIIALGVLAEFIKKISYESIKKALNNQDLGDLDKIKEKALNIGYELGSHKYTHKLGVR